MNIVFITFGSDGKYLAPGHRLINQAKQMNIFNDTILYSAEYLQKDSDFWNKHGTFIRNNRRGYGYWLWKSYIIKKTMENMADDDILLYLDCGCELGLDRKDELLKCIDIVKTDKIIGTTTCKERDWNKMDLIEKLDMNKNEYLDTPQRQAGTNLFLVCKETRALVNEWYEISSDYHNIDDSASIITNFNCFKEHRHDQSIFSLLTKKYNLFSSKKKLSGAIYYIRNKTDKSRISD